jgi:preprotein translocase subunit SecD
MITVEDRARAAMRAIAGTVNDAPPLRLAEVPRSHRSLPGGGLVRHRRGGWLAPLAAAAVVVLVVAVSLIVVKSIDGGGPAASTGLSGSSASVSITLSPVTPASADELAAAARLISERVVQSGLPGAASVSGRNVVLTGPAADKTALEDLARMGVLRFRHVLLEEPAGGAANGDPSLVQPGVLRLFRKLVCTPGESDTAWQHEVGYTAPADWNDPAAQVISCSGGTKYVLDAATVLGQEVTRAVPAQFQPSGQWLVALTLNGAGASAFSALTTHLYNTYCSGAAAGNLNDMALDQVAAVLDGTVLSAPETEGPVTGGQLEIAGNSPAGLTRAAASDLAAELQYGPLPVAFRVAGTSTSG